MSERKAVGDLNGGSSGITGIEPLLERDDASVLVDTEPFSMSDVVESLSRYAGAEGTVIHDDVLGVEADFQNVEPVKEGPENLEYRCAEIKRRAGEAVEEGERAVYVLTTAMASGMLSESESHERFLDDVLGYFKTGATRDNMKAVIVDDSSVYPEKEYSQLVSKVDARMDIDQEKIVYRSRSGVESFSRGGV